MAGCSANYVADCDGVVAFTNFLPRGRHRIAENVVIIEECGASGISNHPFAVCVFCPIRNRIPIRGLVGLNNVFALVVFELSGECKANVADCSGRITFEHGKFLCGAHIGVVMSNAVFSSVAFPAFSPVCPRIRHTNGFKMAFGLCFLDNLIKGVRVEVYCIFVVAAGATSENKGHASKDRDQFEQVSLTHCVPSLLLNFNDVV